MRDTYDRSIDRETGFLLQLYQFSIAEITFLCREVELSGDDEDDDDSSSFVTEAVVQNLCFSARFV